MQRSEASKTTLGSAAFIMMDDSTDMVKVAHRFMQFYKTEFYGKCTSCPPAINFYFLSLNGLNQVVELLRT